MSLQCWHARYIEALNHFVDHGNARITNALRQAALSSDFVRQPWDPSGVYREYLERVVRWILESEPSPQNIPLPTQQPGYRDQYVSTWGKFIVKPDEHLVHEGVADEGVQVHASPSFSSHVVHTLPSGSRFEASDEHVHIGSGHRFLRHVDGTGWVSTRPRFTCGAFVVRDLY